MQSQSFGRLDGTRYSCGWFIRVDDLSDIVANRPQKADPSRRTLTPQSKTCLWRPRLTPRTTDRSWGKPAARRITLARVCATRQRRLQVRPRARVLSQPASGTLRGYRARRLLRLR